MKQIIFGLLVSIVALGACKPSTEESCERRCARLVDETERLRSELQKYRIHADSLASTLRVAEQKRLDCESLAMSLGQRALHAEERLKALSIQPNDRCSVCLGRGRVEYLKQLFHQGDPRVPSAAAMMPAGMLDKLIERDPGMIDCSSCNGTGLKAPHRPSPYSIVNPLRMGN